MRFLISNDDGVYAPGLLALYHALSNIGEVTVVAPNVEQSGCGSALHISQPLHAHTLTSGFVAVDGSPADCIYLALHELYRDTRFDCIITGINAGENLGQDVLFSGTFGAALTAQLFGVPAIATSLVGGTIENNSIANEQDQASRYQMAAEEIVKLITQTSILAVIKGLPYYVLNVNIPNVDSADAIKGYKFTRLSHSRIAKPVHHIVDPRGRDAYWLSLRKQQPSQTTLGATESLEVQANTQVLNHKADTDTDIYFSTDAEAVAAGYISLSPVKLHHTPAATLDKLSTLVL